MTVGSLAFLEENQSLAITYAVGVTFLVAIVVFIVMLTHYRRMKLNWYEANLIEMASSPPHYVRCKALNRYDSDSEFAVPKLVDEERPQRKQSRISNSVIINELPKGDLSGIFTVPKAAKTTTSMFRNLDQSQIDRGLYKTLQLPESEGYGDESIGFCGTIKLSISTDENLNLLTVGLVQAIELHPKRQDGNPNPYFRVSLDVPDGSEQKTQQTKIYRDSSSPLINEEFYFQVPADLVAQCRLEVMAYDFDQFSVDECIGYCWLTLGRLNVSGDKQQPTTFWAEVLPYGDNAHTSFGEVLFSLTYLSKAQRLTINMFKARNLCTDSCDHTVAIRITVMTNNEKKLKRKKTSSKKNARNPQFNESLTFGVAKNSLCDIILQIEAVQEYGTFGMGSKVIGKMELPLHKCKELWRTIIREEKSQARWYSLEEP
ncbi:hypothetical protein QR680_017751 [Steinernema hermaphroditum]|uniref:C2 domain-containing protein n=1 Tax=Steinernema hermaphroditum TaxID=289476 RepID=A0AA39HGB8_9BILA|nr:hypothetical protein QR680_017751 [Steinernema hermaphroditum]